MDDATIDAARELAMSMSSMMNGVELDVCDTALVMLMTAACVMDPDMHPLDRLKQLHESVKDSLLKKRSVN